MKRMIIVVSLLGWLVVANAAEEKKAASKPADDTKPYFIGEDPGPLYTQLVTQWADATNFAKNASDAAVLKLKADMEKDPKLSKLVTPAFTADLEQFFYELFASRETITELAKLYSQYFTLDEMNELVKFYKSPLGVKLVKHNMVLTTKSQQIGANLFKRHENEYLKVLAKYLAPEALKKAAPTKSESAPAASETQTPK
ncbi:MAG TPA: DUF2059 domain-containing protein [Candidatus Berkiella sp.]|nr:DUF2059 domain-containing protein [Candidatus Berkiella sp.]